MMKLRDIANAANVSLTTVSLVLNEKPGVGRDKRAEIIRLLEDNGYTLRSERSGENSNKSLCLLRYIKHGYLVNGNPGFTTRIVESVEKHCRRNGYSLQIVTAEDTIDASAIPLLRKASVKGVIVLGTEMDVNEQTAARLKQIRKPLVIVDSMAPTLHFSCVSMSNRESIFEVVEYLKALDHTDFGFLPNSIPCTNDSDRLRAFRDAVPFYGLTLDESNIHPCFPTVEGAHDAIKALLDQGVRFPSAVIANNDLIAIGALKAFQEAGIRVPEDISLVGFDGLPFSSLTEPPLSTVSVSCSEIGRWAVTLLTDQIASDTNIDIKMIVGTDLLVRGSTAVNHIRGAKNPHVL